MEKTFVYKDFIESATGGVLDQTLSMTPGVNLLWGGLKNAINGTKNMRILRGIEFFETIGMYPEFIKELESSEQAMDGLAMCFESHTKERNKNKRDYIKNILIGFLKLSEENRKTFELEKMLDIINKISSESIFYLKIIKEYILDKNKNLFGNYLNLSSEKIDDFFIYDKLTGSNLSPEQIRLNKITDARFDLLNINNTLDDLPNKIGPDDLSEEFIEFMGNTKLELEIMYKNELSNLGLLRLSIENNNIQYYITPTLLKFLGFIIEEDK